MLQKISDAESIDDISDLVQLSMSRPENQGTHPVTEQETYEALKDNARRFTDMTTRLEEINKMFDQTFDPNTVPPELRKQLSYQLVMGENWQERLDSIIEEQGLSPSYVNNMSAQVGGRKGYDIKERAQSKIVDQLERTIQDKEDELDDLQYKWVSRNGKNKRVKRSGNQKEISLLKQELKTLKRIHTEEQAKLEEIKDFNPDNIELITSDRMKYLSLDDLSTMLNPENSKYYSAAQQAEINAFVDELVSRDPEAVQKITDAATLDWRIDKNRAAYNRLITSPTDAVTWSTEM